MKPKLIEDIKKDIGRIRSMEKADVHKEHIEHVAAHLREKYNDVFLLPPVHPAIVELAALVKKYAVE